jgi:hypothetical protein
VRLTLARLSSINGQAEVPVGGAFAPTEILAVVSERTMTTSQERMNHSRDSSTPERRSSSGSRPTLSSLTSSDAPRPPSAADCESLGRTALQLENLSPGDLTFFAVCSALLQP